MFKLLLPVFLSLNFFFKYSLFDMPFSYHSHSGQFCHHGYGELEQVVQQAIKKNFKIYGLTEHMPRFDQSELYPEELEVGIP